MTKDTLLLLLLNLALE